MAADTVSLRDIAIRLGLPPSTVVYYRDRFGEFLPAPAFVGRRKRYPPEAVAVIRTIREMFDSNLSTEEIRKALSGNGNGPRPAKGRVPPAERDDASSRDVLACRLDEMTALLRDQEALKNELAALRDELTLRGRAADEAEEERRTELAALREELEKVTAQRDFMERYILKSIQRDNIFHSSPSNVFLELPLVIVSRTGEYLGVSGKSHRMFTIRSLVSLLQSNTNARMDIAIRWERNKEAWDLRVEARDREHGTNQSLALTFKEAVTPSRNIVARLTDMILDGKKTPEKYIRALFKQFKDSLD